MLPGGADTSRSSCTHFSRHQTTPGPSDAHAHAKRTCSACSSQPAACRKPENADVSAAARARFDAASVESFCGTREGWHWFGLTHCSNMTVPRRYAEIMVQGASCGSFRGLICKSKRASEVLLVPALAITCGCQIWGRTPPPACPTG